MAINVLKNLGWQTILRYSQKIYLNLIFHQLDADAVQEGEEEQGEKEGREKRSGDYCLRIFPPTERGYNTRRRRATRRKRRRTRKEKC